MSDTEQAITMKTCTRCGATWYPRTPGRPVGCAKCHSPYWDKPRVYKLRNRPPARPRGEAAETTTEEPATPLPPQTTAPAGRASESLATYRCMKAEQRGQL